MPISSYARLRIFLSLIATLSAFVVSMAFSGAAQASGPSVTTFTGRHLTANRAAQAQVSLQAKAQA